MVPISEMLTLASNHGFPIVMALLFWRYIRTQQKEMATAVNELTRAIHSLEQAHRASKHTARFTNKGDD